jgi:hypothetical protein
MPVCSMPVCSMPVCSMPVCSMPVCSMPVSHMPVSHMPVSHMPVSHMPVSHMPVSHMPVSHIPVSRIYARAPSANRPEGRRASPSKRNGFQSHDRGMTVAQVPPTSNRSPIAKCPRRTIPSANRSPSPVDATDVMVAISLPSNSTRHGKLSGPSPSIRSNTSFFWTWPNASSRATVSCPK